MPLSGNLARARIRELLLWARIYAVAAKTGTIQFVAIEGRLTYCCGDLASALTKAQDRYPWAVGCGLPWAKRDAAARGRVEADRPVRVRLWTWP